MQTKAKNRMKAIGLVILAAALAASSLPVCEGVGLANPLVPEGASGASEASGASAGGTIRRARLRAEDASFSGEAPLMASKDGDDKAGSKASGGNKTLQVPTKGTSTVSKATEHAGTSTLAKRKSAKRKSAKSRKKADVFEPAKPLRFFRNIDPQEFEWVNPDEIQAGEVTCGFLHANLGSMPDVSYPKVKTYFCVKFAEEQPAPRGNMIAHCGGPGSLSGCAFSMASVLDEEAQKTYNIIGFDQRGMGRSEPSFVVEDCTDDGPDNSYGSPFITDYTSETSIREAARATKRRNLGCWKHEAFKLPAPDETSDKFFHFLEYSGTRQAAEDMERVRKLFGDQKLSIYGISYGTKVMGTYATVFPDSVNLMVLDGNDDPNVDIAKNAEDIALSLDHRLDYFISTCSAESINGEGGVTPCGIEDASGCVQDLNDFVHADFTNLGEDILSQVSHPHILMIVVIQWLYVFVNDAPELCQIAKERDIDGFRAYFFDKTSAPNAMADTQVISPSQPSYGGSPIYGNPDYVTIEARGSITQNLVVAQDYIFGPYREDSFVKTLMDLNAKYPGAGTQMPVLLVRQWYAACYHWPISTPLPPLGHPGVSGIVAGQIWDPFTPYIWTQKMSENFQTAALLTSRSFNHGLSSARDGRALGLLDPACQAHVNHYFKTGKVDFTNGATCMSQPPGDICSISEIVYGGLCFATPSPTTYYPTSSPIAA